MIKMCDASLVVPLKLLFENCLHRGIFPDTWERANVVPIHKKNEKNLKENYRPISLLPIFGKILEKLIYESLYSHVEKINFLDPVVNFARFPQILWNKSITSPAEMLQS